jgi:hypothetical protein
MQHQSFAEVTFEQDRKPPAGNGFSTRGTAWCRGRTWWR